MSSLLTVKANKEFQLKRILPEGRIKHLQRQIARIDAILSGTYVPKSKCRSRDTWLFDRSEYL